MPSVNLTVWRESCGQYEPRQMSGFPKVEVEGSCFSNSCCSPDYHYVVHIVFRTHSLKNHLAFLRTLGVDLTAFYFFFFKLHVDSTVFSITQAQHLNMFHRQQLCTSSVIAYCVSDTDVGHATDVAITNVNTDPCSVLWALSRARSMQQSSALLWLSN